jgi:hypothetical protein
MQEFRVGVELEKEAKYLKIFLIKKMSVKKGQKQTISRVFFGEYDFHRLFRKNCIYFFLKFRKNFN